MDTGSGAAAHPVIAPARLRVDGDQPFSLEFDDIYHAPDGAAEVQRVFLAPTDFAARARDRAGAAGGLTIGELGFGSGLNFAVAATRALEAGCALHFISFEAAPLAPEAFHALAARRAAQLPLYRELAQRYPPLLCGWHRRSLAGGRIRLSLYWGTADAGLDDIEGRQRRPVDAWFLDGFAPDRNPDLWAPELLARIGPLSGPGTQVATFTSAGRVRRGLEAAGFTMRRVDQRPHKRESLAGVYQADGAPLPAPIVAPVLVVGAGLAGASVARRLAEAGHAVQVVDPFPPGALAATARADRPAGSAMPAAVAHGRLLADGSNGALLRAHAYLHAVARLAALPAFETTGVLQLPGATQPADKLDAIAARFAGAGDWLRAVSAAEASELTGWRVPEPGLWFAHGGILATPDFCRALLDHPGIELRRERLAELPGQGLRVLACGAAVRDFAAARYLELAPVYGQLDLVGTPARPRAPVVGNGYLTPLDGAPGDLLAAGATYEYRRWAPEQATAANLRQLEGHPYQWRARCRGTRTVASDRNPIAGLLHDRDGSALPDLYVSTAHGSMGTLTSLLAAELIAASISGEFAPLTRPLEALLSPARFRERQARRGYRQGASG